MKQQKQHTKPLLIAAVFMLLPSLASAEFRAVNVLKAVVYDSPSAQSKKLYLFGQGYPVEVIVNLAEWVKVRDQQGGLSWIDTKQLSTKRTLLIVSPVEIKQAPEASGALVARVEKDVVVDFLEPAKNGWVKVKHRDGLVGFVQASAVWGL